MSVIISPIVSEKTTMLQEKYNQYVFEVNVKATKQQIRVELEKLYPEVTITDVRTNIVPTKPKGRFTKKGFVSGRSAKWKKAIVSLKEGDTIDFFEEV